MQLNQKKITDIKSTKSLEFANVQINNLILFADNVHVLMPQRLPTATNLDATARDKTAKTMLSLVSIFAKI